MLIWELNKSSSPTNVHTVISSEQLWMVPGYSAAKTNCISKHGLADVFFFFFFRKSKPGLLDLSVKQINTAVN